MRDRKISTYLRMPSTDVTIVNVQTESHKAENVMILGRIKKIKVMKIRIHNSYCANGLFGCDVTNRQYTAVYKGIANEMSLMRSKVKFSP